MNFLSFGQFPSRLGKFFRGHDIGRLVNQVSRRDNSFGNGLGLFDRLIRIQWLPEDYDAYKQHRDGWSLRAWVPWLRTYAQRHGAAWSWSGDPAALDAQLAKALPFYEIAGLRDVEMITRAMEKMDADDAHAAVMIIGGFHARSIRERLIERGVQVALVTPQVGQENDDARYMEILKTKHEKFIARRQPAGTTTSSAGVRRPTDGVRPITSH